MVYITADLANAPALGDRDQRDRRNEITMRAKADLFQLAESLERVMGSDELRMGGDESGNDAK